MSIVTIATKLIKDTNQRTRLKTALKLGGTIIGAVACESFKKDPRAIRCQTAMMSLNFGLDIRLYAVSQLYETVANMESNTVAIKQLVEFGVLSDELKDKCFHEELVEKADLSYPIIVDRKTGLVLDGRHRLAKAKRMGMNVIEAYLVDADALPYAKRCTITNKMKFVNI